MECSEPGALRDEEFFAHLAGEPVRPAALEHLACCEHCSARLAEYRRAELKLQSTLYRWDCPPNQLLGEYQLGLLSNDQAGEVQRHLSRCVLCSAEVATLAQFLSNDPMLVERAAPQKRVPVRASSPNNHHTAQDAQRILETLREQAHSGIRRIAAALTPQQPRLAFQQRDPSQQVAQWPRRYTAEDVNISLQVERLPARRDALQLIGFITRSGATLEALQGIPVQLAAQASTVFTQQIDELGNFIFAGVLPATYTLEVQFPERIIVIDQLTVAAEDLSS